MGSQDCGGVRDDPGVVREKDVWKTGCYLVPPSHGLILWSLKLGAGGAGFRWESGTAGLADEREPVCECKDLG